VVFFNGGRRKRKKEKKEFCRTVMGMLTCTNGHLGQQKPVTVCKRVHTVHIGRVLFIEFILFYYAGNSDM
jgi:hypothetical protein